jgi:hypothetical protein
MNLVYEYFDDFISLFYPQLCAGCGQALNKGEEVICAFCRHYLPKTHFHLERNNTIERHFWGRVSLERCASCYFFQKGSRVAAFDSPAQIQGKKRRLV